MAVNEVRSEVERTAVDPALAAAAVRAVNGLAVGLHRRLSPGAGNLVFSPVSIAVVLAMARNGAVGATRDEMDQVLGADPGPALDEGFNALDRALVARNGERGFGDRLADVTIRSANALWVQDQLALAAPFLDVLARHHGAGVATVDFGRDPEGARRTINEWVSDRTNAKIPELLAPGVLDPLTRLVITNAVHFKAPWSEAGRLVGDEPFTRPDGSRVVVPTMAGGSGGRFGRGPGWQAASLPYLGRELSMVVVVPDDLAAFEATLDEARLDSVVAGLDQYLVHLRMPTFRFRSSALLSGHLAALGMPLAFTDAADFSAMTATEPIWIDEVVHEGFIAVDEEGTEAAAATAMMMRAAGAPMGEELVVDRPFLFAIRDDVTGAIVFLGRVTDPSDTTD